MFNYRCYKETPFESLLIPLSFPYKDIYCEQMKYSLMYYVL